MTRRNVRQLENLIERLVVTAEGNTVTPGDLPDHFLTRTPSHGGVIVKDICPLKEAIEDLERQLVLMAYRKHKNTYKCAEVLKVNQSTVVRKFEKIQEGVGNMSTIQGQQEESRTEERSRSLHERRLKAVPRGPYNTTPIYAASARGR